MSIERKALPIQHYLYVDREASFTGGEIANAMGSGFGEVFGFISQQGILPLSMPMTVYLKMPGGDKMAFRCGAIVSEEDSKCANGVIKSDVIPACEVFTTTHTGPYANLNETHKALWDHMETQGVAKAMPVWEIYIDDPGKTPEAELRTEIYRALCE